MLIAETANIAVNQIVMLSAFEILWFFVEPAFCGGSMILFYPIFCKDSYCNIPGKKVYYLGLLI